MTAFLVAAARTAIVLVVLLVSVRLVGRRHTGELNVGDILLVLLVSNAVQNAMTGGSGRLVVALASASALLAVGWLAGRAFTWSPAVERLVGGEPVLLVHDGTVIRENLRRQQLTDDELLAAVRKLGLPGLADVGLGVLEPNGSISIVARRSAPERRTDDEAGRHDAG